VLKLTNKKLKITNIIFIKKPQNLKLLM